MVTNSDFLISPSIFWKMIPHSRIVLINTLKNLCCESAKFGKYNLVAPGNISKPLVIPELIPKPSYYLTGEPSESINEIDLKDQKQLLQMKQSCKLAANILNVVGQQIKIGQTTDEIDKLVHKLVLENNAYPSPYNYKQFPKSVCTSVNNVACHGIPDDRPLEDGDIINVDVTVFFKGYHGDCSRTFLVGNVDNIGIDLVKFTEECLDMAIDMCRPGRRFRELGLFISRIASLKGYTVIPAFIGHGLGTYFHGPPDIYHIANEYPGVMEQGMTFTIEPVIGQGSEIVEILDDGWTAVTVDGSRTAQFEHTIYITSNGAEILTKPD